MFLFRLGERLGKTVSELEDSLSITELTKWQVFFNQELWENRIMQSTAEGRSAAIEKLLIGKSNG
jgi:hypothetical protein